MQKMYFFITIANRADDKEFIDFFESFVFHPFLEVVLSKKRVDQGLTFILIFYFI